jgi:hypothetical protein
VNRSAACLLFVLLSGNAAAAQDTLARDLQPMDTSLVDPSLLRDFFGAWRIADRDGAKTCDVVLLADETIGGRAIEIDPACASTFPVIDEIVAWRLYEGWGIGLVDIERAARIVFTTPDDAYVAWPETDSIFTIGRLPPG